MRFNYWLEKKKFEEEWQQKCIEYAAAGMPEDDIQRMYEFDLTLFRKERVYQTRSVPLEPSYLQKGRGAPDKSRWLLRYAQALSHSDQIRSIKTTYQLSPIKPRIQRYTSCFSRWMKRISACLPSCWTGIRKRKLRNDLVSANKLFQKEL